MLIDSMMLLSAALIHWFIWDLLVPIRKHLTLYGAHRLLLVLSLLLLPLVFHMMRQIEDSTVRTSSSIAAVVVVALLGCLFKTIGRCTDGNRGVFGSFWSLFHRPTAAPADVPATAATLLERAQAVLDKASAAAARLADEEAKTKAAREAADKAVQEARDELDQLRHMVQAAAEAAAAVRQASTTAADEEVEMGNRLE